MTREELLGAWRAAAGGWAQFMKPALLVQAAGSDEAATVSPAKIEWAPTDGHTALIVELAAKESIEVGAALGAAGWCVVPMFNTTRQVSREVVKTRSIVAWLWGAGERGLPQSPQGPPAFLLDVDRRRGGALKDGDFDNRWFVFPGDFPSAELFINRGIARVQVVARGAAVQEDLSDALAKHAQLAPAIIDPDSGASVPMPTPRNVVMRALNGFGRALDRNFDGTFGRVYSVSQG